MATLLNGKKTAEKITEQLKKNMLAKTGVRPPGLAVVLVGNDPASQIYVNAKQKAAEHVGFVSQVHRLSSEAPQEKVLDLIASLNEAPSIDGILVQLPLPKSLSSDTVLAAVSPQ